jgi:hypothetical protein
MIMAEVATIYRIYGNPGVKSSLANKVGRFATQDSEPGTSNTCRVPPSGSVYNSFRVTDCLGISGDFEQVRDIYIHGDGNFAQDWGLDHANGGGLFVGHRDSGDSGLPIDTVLHGSNQYAVATGTQGTTGHSIEDSVNGHPYYRSQSAPVFDIDDMDPENPLLIDSNVYTTDFYSKAWVMSLRTVPTSVYGAKTPKSVIVTYNIF